MVEMTAGQYVDLMAEQHAINLSTLERSAYVEATEVAMSITEPLNFKELHAILLRGNPTAGVFRQQIVIDRHTGEVRKFPRATAIKQLLRFVYQEYVRMLTQQETMLTATELQLELWRIAAKIRCMRAFDQGSFRLSKLLLGQMRLARGFDFTCEVFSLETYHMFCDKYQNENCQFY